MKNAENTLPIYAERLWPSSWLLIAVLPLAPALWLVMIPFNELAGKLIGASAVASIWLWQLVRATKIEVTRVSLRVGVAVLPRSAIGAVEALTGGDAMAARGPELHPGAFKIFRAGVQSYVKIQVADSSDPTPYWLIATRDANRLATALTATSN